ncbi:MAG TPA: Hsp20/alpha crystallin family protein [Candidatus Hydrogenedentes bacterium]|nr:Hsp20/alpha crystallin family protein [Candidatus Hydrogenedentota bacterium]HPJ97969.1 Hsp20/alpha crystallin family protein [Candidatus Hydrogenedentota bacterium]
MPRYPNIYFQMYAMTPRRQLESFSPTDWEPPLDIYETDTKFVIIAELPGVKKDQVHVRVEQNILTIEGERPKRVPLRTVHVHQMEIPYGRFARRIQLPAETDVERIEAKFREGYLRIEVPRSMTR